MSASLVGSEMCIRDRDRLGQVSPALANAMAQFYSTSSVRWVQEGEAWHAIYCDTGWAQGDPAAPIAYAAGVDQAVRQAEAA
eukprot:1401606-Alexandrium_andersonii.AAC.1